MIPAAVGETAGGGRAAGERAGLLPAVAALGVASSGKEASLSGQLRQSWHEELTGQLAEQSVRLAPSSPSVASADSGPVPIPTPLPASGWERATGQAPTAGFVSEMLSGRLSGLVPDSPLSQISSRVSGRDAAPATELDSELEAPGGFVDPRAASAPSVAAAGPQIALENAKPSASAWIAPQHDSSGIRAGSAVLPNLQASVRNATRGLAHPLEIPAQLTPAAPSAEHLAAPPTHRRSSASGSGKVSMPPPSAGWEVPSQQAGAEQPAPAAQNYASSASPESGKIASPPSSASATASTDRPPAFGFGLSSPPEAASRISWSGQDPIAASSISTAKPSRPALLFGVSQPASTISTDGAALPHDKEDAGQNAATLAGSVPAPASATVLAGRAVLRPLADATENGSRGVSAPALPLAVMVPVPAPAGGESRSLPASAAQVPPSAAFGVAKDGSPLATAPRQDDRSGVVLQGASAIAETSLSGGPSQAARSIPEPLAELKIGSAGPPMSTNAASGPPPGSALAANPGVAGTPAASPAFQVIPEPIDAEPHPVSTEPLLLDGVRHVGSQPAPSALENGAGDPISAHQAFVDAANGNVAALPLGSAESQIAPAVAAAPASAPAHSTPFPLGSEARANRSAAGPARQPDGSRSAAISGGSSSPIADAPAPVTASIAHLPSNVALQVAPNAEGRTDLPAWTPPTGRGEGNPNPFQAMDAAPMPNAAMPVSADSVWTAPGAVIPGALRAEGGSQLQVGYRDPVLGYVELRAHSDGGGVHASLGTQSEMGRAALSGDLSELASWMDSRHTPVESLSVVALHGASNPSSSLAGGRSGPEEFGAGQNAANGGGSEPDSRSGFGPDSGSGSGSGSGYPAGDGAQSGPAPVLSNGQHSAFGLGSSSPLKDSGIGPDAGFAPDEGFGIGGSISILA